MPLSSKRRNLRVLFFLLTSIIIILLFLWVRYKPIQGKVEELIPISNQVQIRYYHLEPSLNISEYQNLDYDEMDLQGSLLKLYTRWGGLYVLRIPEPCKYIEGEYFYLITNNKTTAPQEQNTSLGQINRKGKSFNKYLRLEDITYLDNLDEFYLQDPFKFRISGKRINRKDLLDDHQISERERFVIKNLPPRAKIINVQELYNFGKVDDVNNLWYDDFARFLPWIILLILLLLLSLFWKRLRTFYKRKTMARKENLQEFGYISSGKSSGDPVQFRSYLNGIYNGDISDTGNSNPTENQLGLIQSKIKAIDKSIDNDYIEIEELKNEENLPEFDKIRFYISLFIFIGVTIFSYFFYLSTINKALFATFGNCDDADKLNILPSQVELAQAINNSFFILIVPFVVFALGWILHMVIDNPKLAVRQRALFLVSLISITFLLDFLLASYIHRNISEFKVYCGYGSSVIWYKDTTFYIIIFMGFLVYIFWSLILNNILQQLEKSNKRRYAKKRTEGLKIEIQDLLKRKDRQVSLLDNKATNISGSIDQFHQGWNMYMNTYPDRFRENIKECERMRNEFINKIEDTHE